MLTLKNAISELMRKDRNATWDEIDNVADLRTALESEISEYGDDVDGAAWLMSVLSRLEG